jgi:hypothetical protein
MSSIPNKAIVQFMTQMSQQERIQQAVEASDKHVRERANARAAEARMEHEMNDAIIRMVAEHKAEEEAKKSNTNVSQKRSSSTAMRRGKKRVWTEDDRKTT